MNKHRHAIYITLILAILSGMSCNDQNQKEQEVFDPQKMVTDITDKVILPSINDFKQEAILLEEKVLHFTKELSEESLKEAQQQWKKTAISYANIYAYNIGVPKKKFMHHLLYNWPVFIKGIDKAISSENPVNIDKISTRSKGLTGMEYLLFVSNDMSAKEIVAGFKSNSKKTEYLTIVAYDFKEQALRLSEIWNGTRENYRDSFVNNTETGLKGSVNMLCNGFFNVAETVKQAKLGKPAGFISTSSTNFDLLQAYRSEVSLDLIKNNIKYIERSYFNELGLGISDYVRFVRKSDDVNDKIRSQFKTIYTSLDQINVPLRLAIDTQKEPVENAFNGIKELVWLFNNDVRSTLSIIITPTDNDGD